MKTSKGMDCGWNWPQRSPRITARRKNICLEVKVTLTLEIFITPYNKRVNFYLMFIKYANVCAKITTCILVSGEGDGRVCVLETLNKYILLWRRLIKNFCMSDRRVLCSNFFDHYNLVLYRECDANWYIKVNTESLNPVWRSYFFGYKRTTM